MANITDIKFDTSFNSYRAIGILGEGGSGIVYKVTDDTNAEYAIKCLDASKATKEKRKRFKNEISFSQSIKHKNIVPVMEYGLTQIKGKDCPFYVMPCYPYPSTLRDLMKKGISPEKVMGYFSQILDGVEAAHLKSVWHRDLKPENILYNAKTDTLLIADFGIAHFGEEYLLTAVATDPQSRLANFQYAAPEQKKSGSTVNHKADIFALGLILNEMFTGHILQGSGHVTIASVAPNYVYLDEIVEGMVKQIPDDRYKSIDAIKQKLIANKNDFISRQKLSELTKIVLPQSDIDDLLVNDPIQVTSVDYQNGQLIFTLNHSVNTRWSNNLRNLGSFTSYPGAFEPKRFDVRGNQAMILLPSYMEPNQAMVDMFKNYVISANQNYKESVENEQRQKEEAERKRLQDEMEEEKKRQKIRQTLKI